MVDTRIRRFATLVPEPWRNGGGTTVVLASGIVRDGSGPLLAPTTHHSADWEWRVSIARIERPGPFSPLPGVERMLVPLADDPLLLRIAGRPRRIERHEVVRFEGGSAVESEPMRGAVDVLNVMVRSARAVAEVSVRADPRPSRADDDGLAVALDSLHDDDGETFARGDSLAYRRGDDLPAGLLARITLHRAE